MKISHRTVGNDGFNADYISQPPPCLALRPVPMHLIVLVSAAISSVASSSWCLSVSGGLIHFVTGSLKWDFTRQPERCMGTTDHIEENMRLGNQNWFIALVLGSFGCQGRYVLRRHYVFCCRYFWCCIKAVMMSSLRVNRHSWLVKICPSLCKTSIY